VKIEVVVDGEVVSTEFVVQNAAAPMDLNPSKLAALRTALAERRLRLGEAMTASFNVFDNAGNRITRH
jgi:hypothetical protein